MSINIFNLEKVIAQKIATATSAEDIVYLTSALKQLKNGYLTVVTNFSELPAASSVTEGTLYFVKADKIVYYNENTGVDYQWRPIVWDTYGRVASMGSNLCGLLGDGTVVNSSSPVFVVGGFTDWCQVSVGVTHTSAIRTNGTLWSWGCNDGRFGDGATVARSSPVSVAGGFTDWCQVSAGCQHTVAVRQNGTIWSWADNTFGQLGNGATGYTVSPVSVVGGFTDWCQVSAGQSHTAAVRQNGSLWAWGLGGYGRLGDGTTVNKSSPASVAGGFTDWCQVSGGNQHTAAVRQNGSLWAWGYGLRGRLGDGTEAGKSSPVSVVGGFTDWCQVSAGQNQTSAIRTNGTLWSWGCGGNGKLGDGTVADKSSPVSVVGGFTDWCQIEAGEDHAAAVRTNGTLWSWGRGTDGRLGDGTTVNKSSPVSIISNQGNWSSVSAGYRHTAAINKGIL